jgi:hypothetical protein
MKRVASEYRSGNSPAKPFLHAPAAGGAAGLVVLAVVVAAAGSLAVDVLLDTVIDGGVAVKA